jgi:hypothetical protein
MDTLELKNRIIRKIDSLNETDFEKVYAQLVEILNLEVPYKLSEAENEAVDQALKVSEDGEIYSHEEVVSEAQKKFPNLKFK